METSNPTQEANKIFRQHNGVLRTSQALRLGIHPRTLYAMRDSGLLERLSRGLYRLAELPPLSNPDLTIVALKIPEGVICLISALAFHELTTEIPRSVDVAVQKGSQRPRLEHPPLRVFWFSGLAWSEGVETHTIDEIPIEVYSPAKSVADIFKFRHKLGLNVALESLKQYRQADYFDLNELLHYADICRVDEVIKPYLEVLL
ncbi:MAG: type IV toxin-antitoxin system AbiEi family antitoxin domain-containing protein [Chloroflexota bacterium]|nr:type IV toxin-antitoxin system AbiEi family antitoxin domain-containing protein [Chloroflexota bacterium]